MRRVGILGGMGPEATVLIMQKLLAAVQAGDDADHIPLIVDQNPQVPSRIAHLLEGTGADPAPVLAEMAQRLARAGAMALAMPCNTAHHYADAIRAAVSVPLLDMVALSAAHAATLVGDSKFVGILASPAVRKVGLYEPALAKHGLRALYAKDEAAMLAAIRLIKSQGPQPDARATLLAQSIDLAKRGAKVQLIACTEFSLIAGSVSPQALTFDTLDILVSAISEFAHTEGAQNKLSPR